MRVSQCVRLQRKPHQPPLVASSFSTLYYCHCIRGCALVRMLSSHDASKRSYASSYCPRSLGAKCDVKRRDDDAMDEERGEVRGREGGGELLPGDVRQCRGDVELWGWRRCPSGASGAVVREVSRSKKPLAFFVLFFFFFSGEPRPTSRYAVSILSSRVCRGFLRAWLLRITWSRTASGVPILNTFVLPFRLRGAAVCGRGRE